MSACDCPWHRKNPPVTTVGDHTYRVDDDREDRGWRWRCACGHAGRWQVQSDNAAFHAWERHVGKMGAGR